MGLNNGYWVSHVEFPFELWAEIVRSSPLQRETVMEALAAHKSLYEKAMRMAAEIHELKAERNRLRAENGFLTRLVEDAGNE